MFRPEYIQWQNVALLLQKFVKISSQKLKKRCWVDGILLSAFIVVIMHYYALLYSNK